MGSLARGTPRAAAVVELSLTPYGLPMADGVRVSREVIVNAKASTYLDGDELIRKRKSDCPMTRQLIALQRAAPKDANQTHNFLTKQIVTHWLNYANTELAHFVLSKGVPLVGVAPGCRGTATTASLIREPLALKRARAVFNGAYRDAVWLVNVWGARIALEEGEMSSRRKREFDRLVTDFVERYNRRRYSFNARVLALEEIVRARENTTLIGKVQVARCGACEGNVASFTLVDTPSASVRVYVEEERKSTLKVGFLYTVHVDAFDATRGCFTGRVVG